jgi:hypothetical protein
MGQPSVLDLKLEWLAMVGIWVSSRRTYLMIMMLLPRST